MYYYGVTNLWGTPHGGNIEITAFDDGGTALSRDVVTGNEFIFRENIRPYIRSIEVRYLGEIPSNRHRSFVLLTKRRNDKETYDEAVRDHGPNGVYYWNRADAEFWAKVNNGGREFLAREENAEWSSTYYRLHHNYEILRAAKSSNAQRVLLPGEHLTYHVGVNGVISDSAEWTEFKMLDVLPRYMELTSVRLTDAFSRMPGARYQTTAPALPP
jgi:hypothetical protein